MRFINEKKGAVLLLTFIVMITLAAVAIAFLYMTSVQTKGARLDIVSSKAFWIAEAGLQDVIHRLKNDADYRNSPVTVSKNLADGDYSVEVRRGREAQGNQSTYYITSIGAMDVIKRTIQQSVVVGPNGSYPDGTPEAFYYGMHSFGTHTMFKDSRGTVNGDVAASNFVKDYDAMAIHGNVTTHSDVVSPAPPVMAGYRSIANYIQSGGFTFTAGNTYGNDKIWYITGNVTIESNVRISGSIIAEGNIFLGEENITVDAPSGYPAFISGNNIHGDGLQNSTISGLVFADNNVEFDNLNDVTINGGILSGNNTKMRGGSFTVNFDPDIILNPPPFFTGYEPGVMVMPDWDEIVPAL